MRLRVEARLQGRWVQLGEQLTAGQHGSMSHNGPAGRQIYVFGCDGPYSLVLRSKGGIDVEVGQHRAITSLEGFEEIARLDGSEPFECWLKTDRMTEPTRVRFSHLT